MLRRSFLKSAGAVLVGATSLPLLGNINTTPSVIGPSIERYSGTKYPYIDCIGDLFNKVKGSHKTCHCAPLVCYDGSKDSCFSPYYAISHSIESDYKNRDYLLDRLEAGVEEAIQDDMYHTLICAACDNSLCHTTIQSVDDDYIIFCSPESEEKVRKQSNCRIITNNKFGDSQHNQLYYEKHFLVDDVNGEMALVIKPDPSKFILASPSFSRSTGYGMSQKYCNQTGLIESESYKPKDSKVYISMLSVQTIMIMDNRNVRFLNIT